jgi:hypothetical protein
VTDIGDLNLVLAGTEYEDSIPCIQATFDSAGIKTINDLDNAPRVLNFCVCSFEMYPLVAFVGERVLNPPKRKVASKSTVVKIKAKKGIESPPEIVESLSEVEPKPLEDNSDGDHETKE